MADNIQPEVLKTLTTRRNQVSQGKSRTHSFNVDFSDVDSSFTGKITVHYPSALERITIGSKTSSLLGGNLNVDTMTYNLAFMIATLDTLITEKPDWFDVTDIDVDYDLLNTVYEEYANWHDTFRKQPKPDNAGSDSEATGV